MPVAKANSLGQVCSFADIRHLIGKVFPTSIRILSLGSLAHFLHTQTCMESFALSSSRPQASANCSWNPDSVDIALIGLQWLPREIIAVTTKYFLGPNERLPAELHPDRVREHTSLATSVLWAALQGMQMPTWADVLV